MTEYTRILDRFEYHAEDLDCSCCLLYIRKSKFHKNGCHRETCRFEGIRREAVENGRLKRPKGWFRCPE